MPIEKNLDSIAKSLVSLVELLIQNQKPESTESSPAPSTAKADSSPAPEKKLSPGPGDVKKSKKTEKAPVSDKGLVRDTDLSVSDVNNALMDAYNISGDRKPIDELLRSEPYNVQSINDLKREHYEQLIKDVKALEN